MKRLNNFTVKLVMWGSAPIAFLSGLILSAGINMITTMALFSPATWPSNGLRLLLGSVLYTSSATAFAFLANRVQPFKSSSDERLHERRRLIRPDEQERTDEKYIWDEVLNAEGRASQHERALLLPLVLGLILLLAGTFTFITALPIFLGP